MKIEALKALIEEKLGSDEFHEIVESEVDLSPEFDEAVGLPYKFLGKDSEYSGDDCYDEIYRFQIGDQIFEVTGTYSSWGDDGMDDVMSFYEVRPVERMVTFYEPVV